MISKPFMLPGCLMALTLPFLMIPLTFAQENVREEATRLLAETYLASGQHDKAITAYEKIVKKEPGNIEARIKLAELLSWAKRYEESISEYKAILQRSSNNLEAMKKLAEVYKWAGDIANAEALCRDILKHYPRENDISILLGELLTWQQRYNEAVPLLAKAVEDGVREKAQLLYGQALLYSGRHDLAERVFQELLTKEPASREAGILLADTYAYSKQYSKAIGLYEAIWEQEQDIKVKEKLADVLSWDRQYNRSIALYDEILAEKYDQKIHRQKARVLGWSRRYAEAEKEYNQILAAQHNEDIGIEKEAKTAYWNGKDKKAIEKYKELILRDPDAAEAMFDLSQIYSHQSMWREAADEYHRILAMYPAHFRAEAGLTKTNLISENVMFGSEYRFFEADSAGRDTDIRKHQFLAKIDMPLDKETNLLIEYVLGKRMFSDFSDITEEQGRFTFEYRDNPDWNASGYYGLITYNKDLEEQFHVLGGNFFYRIGDEVGYDISYDREPLENNSQVMRGYFYRHRVKHRFDINISKRLKGGLDYEYAYYTNDNISHEPGIDFLYYLSLDPKRFYVQYRYCFKQFKDRVDDYFSPQGFSTSKITLGWRHFLNKEEVFFGADDIYYDLKYDLSVDSTDMVGHKFSWALNWDISKRFNVNLQGSLMGSSASVYEENQILAGLRYYF